MVKKRSKLLLNFVANLRAACSRRDMNCRQLAAASGVSYVTISRILRGHMQPSVAMCERLSEAVDVDPLRLFSEAKQ